MMWVEIGLWFGLVSYATAFCPTSCLCDDDTLVVSCLEASLDVVPITLNPSIQRLVLKYNKVKTVDAAFQFYGELQYVDLSHNHLVSIPSRSFDSQKKLIELHLKYNKISAITNRTFEGLKKLTVLNLRGNFLEDLPDKLFYSLPQLEELDLGENRINRIDSTAFLGLTSLRVLLLDDNQLKIVPTTCFPTLGSLAELHVGLNVFNQLPDDSFKGLNRLTILNLSGAGLENISDNAFRGLTTLRTLSLTGSRLTNVPTKALSILERLEELALGQNMFTTIGLDAFNGLLNLKNLDITGAPKLEKIEKGFLRENLNLDTLILSINKKLTYLEDGALGGLPNLKHLILRENGFTTFSETLVSWPELRTLDVSENPIHCSCKLAWLKELLVRRNVSQVLCASPPPLKDKPLKLLSSDELGCSMQGPWQHALVGGLCGAVVAFSSLLGILIYRYRRRVRDVFKDYKFNKQRAMASKEHEYRKTLSEDDVNSYYQQTLRTAIPVTEL
ncbi:unnamed protein product [Nezara viridula]|uniref:LRRCT domain-containing protein n=1 Tax=Nezara viridula TaxID=85310 RepID=A0A9P0E6N1_NEZVI|nr:unnamed protein product [Nezara viridula]